MKKKYFIITLDTEADNQWDFDAPVTTKNTKYLPRFQELCEKYTFIPVWLTDYEMACDNGFVSYFKEKQDKGLCEIGMHLHGWTTPPDYQLEQKERERPFIYEYPLKIIEQKVYNITKLLTERFGIAPISHRAGRWALNENYARILRENGYTIDCSVTTGVNWTNTKGQTGSNGPDFSFEPNYTYNYKNTGLLEVPVTIKKIHYFDFEKVTLKKGLHHFLGAVKVELYHLIKGNKQWLRPERDLALKGLKKLVDINYKGSDDYLMFMIHSSELMPGGSPTFKTEESIEELYRLLEQLFDYIKNLGYDGISLRNFGKEIKK
jgi:walW protein